MADEPRKSVPKNDPGVMLPPAIASRINRSHEVFNALAVGEEVPASTIVSPTVRVDGKVIEGQRAAPDAVVDGEVAKPTHPTNEWTGQQSRGQQADPNSNLPETVNRRTDEEDLDLQDRYDKLTARLRTLQGKYVSETQTLRNEITNLTNKLNEASQQIVKLIADNRVSEKTNEKKDLTPSSGSVIFTREEVERFEPELLDLVNRTAQTIAANLVSAKTAELQEKIDGLGKSVTGLDQARRLTLEEQRAMYLDEHVENWREINVDPFFDEWLEHRDALSGFKRSDLLANAIQRGDHSRVALIFKGYIDEQALLRAHTRPNGQAERPNGKGGRVRAETIAAPGRGRASDRQPTAPDAPETFTAGFVKGFYQAKALGRTGLSDAEIADMERRIHEAGLRGAIKRQPRV